MNVITEPEGTASAVLLRGVELVQGIETVSKLRYGKPYETLSQQQKKNFSNGPGKLCNAMGITKEHNGIDYAEEAKDFPWRFYIES